MEQEFEIRQIILKIEYFRFGNLNKMPPNNSQKSNLLPITDFEECMCLFAIAWYACSCNLYISNVNWFQIEINGISKNLFITKLFLCFYNYFQQKLTIDEIGMIFSEYVSISAVTWKMLGVAGWSEWT